MNQKMLQLLAYIAKNNSPVTITGLMKLSYLIDLSYFKDYHKQITGFEYKRYTYGPFDKSIYEYIDRLLGISVLSYEIEYANPSSEYVTFKFNEDTDFAFDSLKKEELSVIDAVLATLKSCGAKALTMIAYKTKPMLALKATLGGNENLGVKLDLGA